MKIFLLSIALMASTACYAQKFNNKEYKASNGITYHLGDTVKIGLGSGVNGQYLNIMKADFMSMMSYNPNGGKDQLNLPRGFSNGNFIIKKIRENKVGGTKKVFFNADAPHLSTYIFIEDAINACEVTPCKDKVSPQLSPADELAKYKKLLDDGAITPDEYAAKKKQLLGL